MSGMGLFPAIQIFIINDWVGSFFVFKTLVIDEMARRQEWVVCYRLVVAYISHH